MSNPIIIIGAGLSGLCSAWSLHKAGIPFRILESNERIGGRIQSIAGEHSEGPFELGATWLGDQHQHLNELLKQLGVERFEQYNKGKAFYEVMSFLPPQAFEVPYKTTPYYRIKGGSIALVEALAKAIGRANIQLKTTVQSIQYDGEQLLIGTKEGPSYTADQVILSLPPQLAAERIRFEPALPNEQLQAMQQTPTWMSHSIKFIVEYERPFWREESKAGMAISQTGMISEVHDHSNIDETAFSLMGFLSAKAAALPTPKRKDAVLAHLARLFGPSASKYRQYIEKEWSKEPHTAAAHTQWLNAHPPYGQAILRQAHFDHRLFFSGSETSAVYGGYMEGAVYAGLWVAKQILKKLEKI
ncbi:MAG: NAD(P)/FAD-dependent oxidoreductase [Bacteroidota bacterium]